MELTKRKTMNPFTRDGESTHEYNGRQFVVDYYPPKRVGELPMWQCSDEGHIVRGRGHTKQEAINEAHWSWNLYVTKKNTER